jgi:hypothetical protein
VSAEAAHDVFELYIDIQLEYMTGFIQDWITSISSRGVNPVVMRFAALPPSFVRLLKLLIEDDNNNVS